MSYTRQEIEAAGLDDFRVFLCEVWAYLGLPKPTRLQLDIAYALQHGEKRLIIEAFRGVGKSWVTVAFVLWHLFLDPQKKIEVVSASESLAQDFTKFCFQLIHGMPLLQHLAPSGVQRASAEKFDVGPAAPAKDPSVKSVGITGQLTGSRADIIIADDIEVPKNSYTHLLRERLSELVKEFDAILKPLPDARIIYLGTPQIEQSLYNRLTERGYTIRIWPAEVPHRPEQYRGRLSKYIHRLIDLGIKPGTPTDPERFSRDDLDERRVSYGASGYPLQFMLDTTPTDAEKHPLKLGDLIVFDCDRDMAPAKLMWGRETDGRSTVITDLPTGGFDGDHYRSPAWVSREVLKYARTVMAVDPSGRGSDETGYAILKELHGILFLLETGGFLDGFGPVTLDTLARRAAFWGVNDVIDETNYGGGMFRELLKPYLVTHQAGRYDEEWKGWSSAQKELRILDVLEPVVKNHKLVVHRRLLETDRLQQESSQRYSFVYQFTRIARIKGALPNEDRLDAVAMAVSYFTERMNRDQEKALQAHKDELLDRELRKFHEHVLGGAFGGSDDRWM